MSISSIDFGVGYIPCHMGAVHGRDVYLTEAAYQELHGSMFNHGGSQCWISKADGLMYSRSHIDRSRPADTFRVFITESLPGVNTHMGMWVAKQKLLGRIKSRTRL